MEANRITTLTTLIMEEYLKGNIDIEYDRSRSKRGHTFESELVYHGYKSMQNQVKKYLIENANGQNYQKKFTEEDIKKIDKLVFSPHQIQDSRKLFPKTLEDFTKVLDQQFKEEMDIFTQILQLCMAKAETDETTESGSAIKKMVIADMMEGMASAYQEKVNRRKEKQEGKQENRIEVLNKMVCSRRARRLLTEQQKNVMDKTRKNLILAACMLGMDLDKTNEFLTKAAFTYRLDYTDSLELKAAYVIEYSTDQPADSTEEFSERIRALEKLTTEQAEGFLDFFQTICFNEYKIWQNEWEKCRRYGLEKEFLCEWTWKRLKSLYPKYLSKKSKSAFVMTKKIVEDQTDLEQKFSEILQDFESFLDGKMEEEKRADLQSWIVETRLDRRRCLLEFIYYFINNEEETLLFQKKNGKTEFYTPVFYNTEFSDSTLEKIKDWDRILQRDDIIKLGLHLRLTLEGMDYMLQTAGFYKLYACNLYENALMRALLTCREDGDILNERHFTENEGAFESLKNRVLQNLEYNFSGFKKIPDTDKKPGWEIWLEEIK